MFLRLTGFFWKGTNNESKARWTLFHSVFEVFTKDIKSRGLVRSLKGCRTYWCTKGIWGTSHCEDIVCNFRDFRGHRVFWILWRGFLLYWGLFQGPSECCTGFTAISSLRLGLDLLQWCCEAWYVSVWRLLTHKPVLANKPSDYRVREVCITHSEPIQL